VTTRGQFKEDMGRGSQWGAVHGQPAGLTEHSGLGPRSVLEQSLKPGS
jgi:hypothetical protein